MAEANELLLFDVIHVSRDSARERYTGRVISIVAVAFAAALSLSPPKAGQPAPDFTLVDQNGKSVSLAAARGAKTVIVFYRGYW